MGRKAVGSMGKRSKTKKRKRMLYVNKKRNIKAYVLGYLLTHPCIECGEEDVRVLEFHHRDKKTKCFDVGGAWGKRNLLAVQKEIDKCDVLCSNCHKKIQNQGRVHKFEIVVSNVRRGWVI